MPDVKGDKAESVLKKSAASKRKLPTLMEPHEQPVLFTEDFKRPKSRECITFDAVSYTNWVREALPIAETAPVVELTSDRSGVAVGSYIFRQLVAPMWYWGTKYDYCDSFGFGLSFLMMGSPTIPVRFRLRIHGPREHLSYCAFSSPVMIPTLSDAEDLKAWMSLTPYEVLTQRSQIRRARGVVGVAGLGLGWITRRLLQRPQVKKVVVVEKDPAVIEFFGRQLLEEYRDRLKIEVGDAYSHNWLQYDVSLWDIWKKYGESQYDSRFKKIKADVEAAGRVCEGWGSNAHR